MLSGRNSSITAYSETIRTVKAWTFSKVRWKHSISMYIFPNSLVRKILFVIFITYYRSTVNYRIALNVLKKGTRLSRRILLRYLPWRSVDTDYFHRERYVINIWRTVRSSNLFEASLLKKKKKNIAFGNLQTTSRLYIVRALNDSTLDVFLLLFVFSIYVCIYKHNWFAITLATCVLPVSIRLSISECKRSYTEARRQLKTSTALFLVVRTNLSYLASNIWNGREDAYRSYEIRIYRQ